MKKITKSILSLLLCVCMVMPMFVFPASAEESYETAAEFVAASDTGVEVDEDLQTKIFLYKVLNVVSDFFINSVLGKALCIVVPDSAAVLDYEEFDINSYENFYPGMDKFIDEPQGDKVWSLGYGKASILPEDFGEKSYAKGAYIPYVYGKEMYKDDDGNYEDLMARVVVMNDGSGRGNVVFIAVDAMGLANSDVRVIREGLKEIAKAKLLMGCQFCIQTGIGKLCKTILCHIFSII